MLALESELVAALRGGSRVVLVAPTGSGKTTQVPQMMLRHGLARGQVVVLQPRRLAARWMARRVAAELGVPLGGHVGYQTRQESRVGPDTRIRFVTEGVLLRQLRDPRAVAGLGAVLLDEFHERSLATDTALALLRARQETDRPDLKLVVMSATLDADRVAAWLSCPILRADTRTWPVDVRWLSHATGITPSWDLAAAALEPLLRDRSGGDVLVFLPGAHEIRRTLTAFRPVVARTGVPAALLSLHGDMTAEEQDEVLRPRVERRVIVATNVAQTSITIEGVRHVIDAGLARIHRFDPLRGLNTLRLEPISRAAADQRAGRAGRTAPGTCDRLWTRREHESRPEHDEPEIRRLELSEAFLLLLDLGVERPESFPWLDPPEPERSAEGRALLARLGAIDANGCLTPTGRSMAALPAHPRLSRLVVEAARRGGLDRACLWAAMLGERDVLDRRQAREFARAEEEAPSDFLVRESAFDAARAHRFDPAACRAQGINAGACRDVDAAARSLRRSARDIGLDGPSSGDLDSLLQCLLVAFPDHLAARRATGGRGYLLAGERPATLDECSVARGAPLILAVEARERSSGGNHGTALDWASRIRPEWVLDLWPERITESSETVWNEEAGAVERISRLCFDGVEIDRSSRPEPDAARSAEVLADRIAAGKVRLEGWEEKVEPWLARARCVAAWFPERGLPAFDAADLRRGNLALCAGAVRASQVHDRDPLDALRGLLSHEDRQFVERMAPDRLELPCGRRMKIEYAPGEPPRGRARIQDLFGLDATPRVAGGRVPVRLEILAPNQRPVQTTDDLAGFWERLYPQVKRELQRRYPRHEWR